MQTQAVWVWIPAVLVTAVWPWERCLMEPHHIRQEMELMITMWNSLLYSAAKIKYITHMRW